MRCLLPALLFALSAQPLGAARLPSLGADGGDVSVSGLSSGAFMAVQFHVAHADVVRGAGVLAGGPWNCARGSASRATGECMQGAPEVAPLLGELREAQGRGLVAAPGAFGRSRVWLFSGYNDGVVRPVVVERLRQFYAAILPAGSVFLRNDLRAGHAMVTTDSGGACDLTGGSFMADCDFDAAGALLRFIHGPLEAPAGSPSGRLVEFEQGEFVSGGTRAAGLADTGRAWIPAACAAGARCRIHVALHGCRQSVESVGAAFVSGAGYNRWADSNRMVILYPQARTTWGMPFNPNGCWDWWGFTGPRYATREGVQVKAIKAMVDRLASGTPRAAGAGAAAGLPAVAEAGARAVAITWNTVPGAAGYELEGGGHRVLADPRTRSAALDDLTAATAVKVRWRALDTTGRELAAAQLPAATLPLPPRCDTWFASNVAHVSAGRAYVAWGLAYALGTNQPMGWWNVFSTSQLRREGRGWAVGTCP
jgi:poly(3-hydroxybutyrate) depolymerase